MAKVLTDPSGMTHLKGKDGGTLCGEAANNAEVADGVLTCPACAKLALAAIELTTKQERRGWREL